jgi:transposase
MGTGEDAAMVRIALTGESRKALVARLQQAYGNRATRLVRRIHALLGLAEGQSVYETAQLLGIGEQTVRDWLHAFVLDGVASLFYRPRPGRPPKLTPAQRAELRQLVVDGPEAAGYSSACWTAGMIADLIRLRFKVGYAPRYVCHLLDRLGFSYQKGKFTADHLDDEAALLWLEETWPEILRVAQEKQAVILFGDEASFAQWGSLGYTWALKGIQPTVKTSGIRKAYRAFGLLDCFGGALYFQGLDGKFTSETYRGFLEWALDRITGHIILIQDNASYHTSGPLHTFYAARADRLTVYQLPAYSPDLNPIEGLWQKVKEDATHLRYFPTFAALVAKVTETLSKFAGLPRELTALAGEYRALTPLVA